MTIKTTEFDIRVCKNILVPRFDTFGDIVLTEGLIEALLDFLPEARITLLVREGYDQLAALFPDRLLWKTTSIHPYRAQSNMAEIKSLIGQLKEGFYDLILTTAYNRTWLDDLLAAALISSCRVALGKEQDMDEYLTEILMGLGIEPPEHLYDECIPVDERCHETEKYQTLWRSITGKAEPIPRPKLVVPDDESKRARDFLAKAGMVEGKFVFCFPAGVSNVPLKTWPEDNFAEVITHLEKNYSLRTLVCAHEAEKGVVDKVVELARFRGVSPEVWLGKDGDIPLACALIAKCSLYFGNDTGMMHIASALDKPVVAIFGGGTWPRFLPRTNTGCVFVLPLPCFHCMWDCCFSEPLCIQFLSADNVVAEMGNFLEKMWKGDAISKIVETNLNSESLFMFFKKSIESILFESNKLKISKADSAARLRRIHELEEKLQYVQLDSEARLSLIHELERKLQHVQADSEARLHELEASNDRINTIESTRIYRVLQKIGFFHFK